MVNNLRSFERSELERNSWCPQRTKSSRNYGLGNEIAALVTPKANKRFFYGKRGKSSHASCVVFKIGENEFNVETIVHIFDICMQY